MCKTTQKENCYETVYSFDFVIFNACSFLFRL